MKPMGAIPADYRADGEGMLLIGGTRADALVAEAGDTPLFVYDFGIARARVARFRAAFPAAVALHYAVKANPMPALIAAMRGLVDGFDIASGGELARVLAAGGQAARISFAGPGKRDDELSAAIRAGVTLNVESAREAERAFAIGAAAGVTPRLAVRVNPDFALKGSGMRMGGGAKPFGVDAAAAPALVRRIAAAGADYRGLHIYAGSQALDADALIEAQTATLALAGRIADGSGIMAPTLNLGGGFGIPYFPNERPLEIERIGEALAARAGALPGTALAIELGRWLVGEAGVYLTRIVDRKESHGEIFLVTDGGLHHQLAASGNFGTVVRRNYPVAIASRFRAAEEEEANVVGCLCTPLDRLGEQIGLPRAEEGDLVAVFMAGAYGASASPAAFLGHAPAREMMVGMD